MVERRIREAVEYFGRRLKEQGIRVSQIILFGSQAQGVATAESDIDFIVVSEDFRGKDIFERAQLTKDAEIATVRKFMLPLDILTLSPEEMGGGASPVSDFVRDGECITG